MPGRKKNPKTYKLMEGVLQTINRDFVTLAKEEVKENNLYLKLILDKLINLMRNEDPVFDALFKEPFYGGSFYDDLKVQAPDEFDIDLVMALPPCQIHQSNSCECVYIGRSNKRGFVWFKLDKNYYPPLNAWMDEKGYMQTDSILNWLKSLLVRAIDTLRTHHDPSVPAFGEPRFDSESGPALTVVLLSKIGYINIDIVPSFKFGEEDWPETPFRRNPVHDKPDFFLVPKKAKDFPRAERYWRCSFQSQERELINGQQHLKPALRLLKKMRNNLEQHAVSSYALKNIVLWELNTKFFVQKTTLSDTFMGLLNLYRLCLRDRFIRNYWYKKENLIGDKNPVTLMNWYSQIENKIEEIKKNHKKNPEVVAKIILREGSSEYEMFMKEYKSGK